MAWDTVVALVDDGGQCAVHYLGDAPSVVALSKDMCDGYGTGGRCF